MSKQIEELALLYGIAGLIAYTGGLTWLSVLVLCRISFLAYQYTVVRAQEQQMQPLIQQMLTNANGANKTKEPMGFSSGTMK